MPALEIVQPLLRKVFDPFSSWTIVVFRIRTPRLVSQVHRKCQGRGSAVVGK